MSSAIVAKLRKGREVRIDLDKPKGNGQFFVVALRPTDIEMSEIYALKGAHQVPRLEGEIFAPRFNRSVRPEMRRFQPGR